MTLLFLHIANRLTSLEGLHSRAGQHSSNEQLGWESWRTTRFRSLVWVNTLRIMILFHKRGKYEFLDPMWLEHAGSSYFCRLHAFLGRRQSGRQAVVGQHRVTSFGVESRSTVRPNDRELLMPQKLPLNNESS